MGWFSRRRAVCPVCGAEVDTTSDGDGVGHFMHHLDDAVRGDPSRLAFGCGCPDAAWPVEDDFTALMMKHLIGRHRVPVPDIRGRNLNALPEWERRRGRQQYPPTPYGYVPPPDAAVLGWQCTNRECRRGEGGLPDTRHWPRRCPDCGSHVGTGAMRDPWEHQAKRLELDVRLQHPRDEIDRSLAIEADFKWRYKEALRRGDRVTALAVRHGYHEYAMASGYTPESYPHYARIDFARLALDYGFMDDVATILMEWFAAARANDVETDGMAKVDCRQLAHAAISFIEHPYSRDHALQPSIHEGLTQLVEDIQEVMTADLWKGVRRLSSP